MVSKAKPKAKAAPKAKETPKAKEPPKAKQTPKAKEKAGAAKKAILTKRDRDKIRKVLMQRRAEILSDLDVTDTEIDNLQDPKADDLDRAVEAGTMELLVTLGDTERRELEEITWALQKLEAGTYGICEACQEQPRNLCPTCPYIPLPRLEALPTARLCVACQEAEEKSQTPSFTRLRPRPRIFGEDGEEFTHPLMDSNDDT